MIILKKNIEKWLPHFLGLLLFFILPLFVFDRENPRSMYWLYSYYYQLLVMGVAFYVNYLLIVPRYFFTGKKYRFFLALVLFAFILSLCSQFLYLHLDLDRFRSIGDLELERPKPPVDFPGVHPKAIDNLLLIIVVLGFSSGMAIIQHFRKNENRQKEIEKANVDSELAFLKNQISPHFFFNALNNIYAQIAIDGEKAQQSVEQLSVLMRYLIYESNVAAVDLQKELQFIDNYIELMRQRLNSKVSLKVHIDSNIPSVKLPPLLFIPFIENAFKHGISYRQKSFIDISINLEDDQLVFKCINSIPEQRTSEKGGIGMQNIKQRLSLLYADRASLNISDVNHVYHVNLCLPLKLETDE